MPIYEYECASCTHRLEEMQKMVDDPLTDCPKCGTPSLKKLISAVGFRLKGTGWYETDFKTKKPAEKSRDGESKKADSGESKKGSGESKGSGGCADCAHAT